MMKSFILIYRLYVSTTTLTRNVDANRLLRTRPTFSRSLMVSVAVSKLGCTELFFVEPGVKVNGEYYRNVLLMEKMLPAIWGMSSDFIFQEDSPPRHIEQRTPLRCCDVKHQASLDRNSGQQTHQTSIQLNLGSNTGTRLPDSNTEHCIDELKERRIVVWAEFKQHSY